MTIAMKPDHRLSTLNIVFLSSGTGISIILSILEFFLQTGWLLLLIPIVVGGFSLTSSIAQHSFILFITGSLLIGSGFGFLIGFLPSFHREILDGVGILLTGIGAGFFLISAGRHWIFHSQAWWASIPAGLLLGTGTCLFMSNRSILDFVLFTGVGLGLALLGWGIVAKLLGLIIPGTIIITTAPGIAISWRIPGTVSVLSQTGIMLIWFSLGWALITVCSRVITDTFIWWPLIPGAVLAAVGTSLYIGGNPIAASGFVNNSAAMGVLIFGVYLFLIRSSFRW
jgi:hypothetical protein